MQILAADIGGTHARFVLADITADGAIVLGDCITLATSEFSDISKALDAFSQQSGAPLPRAIAVAAAGPVRDDAIVLTNNRWTIERAALASRFDRVTLINDFGAVAHAAARAAADRLVHIAGPDCPLPEIGTISVIGPGTGLGVAYFYRDDAGYRVQATEGGHIGFAPQDEVDDRIMAALRARHGGRVASERVVAGPGIAPIYAALGGTALDDDDRAIWAAGLARSDAIASASVDRFCASLGTAAGDYALAHGASGVILAGGIGLKLRDRLPSSDFGARFAAKPRYEAMMAAIPVKLITHPQPGLFGAAAAFAAEHGADL